jgi:hypothetical protein
LPLLKTVSLKSSPSCPFSWLFSCTATASNSPHPQQCTLSLPGGRGTRMNLVISLRSIKGQSLNSMCICSTTLGWVGQGGKETRCQAKGWNTRIGVLRPGCLQAPPLRSRPPPDGLPLTVSQVPRRAGGGVSEAAEGARHVTPAAAAPSEAARRK